MSHDYEPARSAGHLLSPPASAAGTGFTVLVVRIAPSVQSDAGAAWLLGGLMAEAGLTVVFLAATPTSIGSLPTSISWLTGSRALRAGASTAAGALVLSATVLVLASASGLDQQHLGNTPGLRPDQVLGPALLTSAVLPGVFEEVFFRGLLFNRLGRLHPAWLAMLTSSGLFALGHLGGDMVPLELGAVGLSTFLSGCLFALAYARTGTIYASILAHSLFDIVPTAGLTLGPERGQFVGLAVILVGYAVAYRWWLVPTLRRSRARRQSQSVRAALLSDVRDLWTAAMQSTPEPREEPH